MQLPATHLPLFLRNLRNPALYPHPAADFRVFETHASWILLAGEYAYKFKKPVNFGFLDFSTLIGRHFCCTEEIRLNRRLAPDLYLGLALLHGDEQHPCWEGKGMPFEYAVKMRRFDPEFELDRLAVAGRLENAHLDAIARRVAEFHAALPPAPVASEWGTPEAIYAPVLGNFDGIRACRGHEAGLERLEPLETWSRDTYHMLRPVFAARRAGGFIRECHGDMHLGNMVLYRGQVEIFDALEFNPGLRWIDPMNELAFLSMDLQAHACPQGAARVLNAWLEHSGDYAGLEVFRFYLVYRALVRAKVALLQSAGHPRESPESSAGLEEYRNYLESAHAYIHPAPSFLYITHGVAGSGKTTRAQTVLEQTGAIRLRSDVERKRAGPVSYAHDARAAVYRNLEHLARRLLATGYAVIVDATFLEFAQRARFRRLAAEFAVPFGILACHATREQLHARLAERRQQGGDASDADAAVLERQLAEYKELREEELPFVI